jgi:hypothetical protein
MDRSWKILFAVVLAAIVWYSWKKSRIETDRALRVRMLAGYVNRDEFKQRAQPDTVQASFFKILAQMHQNAADEPPPGFMNRTPHDAAWYLDEALRSLDFPEPERLLLKSNFLNSYSDARLAGAFDQSDSREALAAGRGPTISRGTFAGEPLRVGWRVSPVLVPELLNHPANFKLMPGIAWSLQQERIDDASYGAAREIFGGGVLSTPGWEAVQRYHRDSKKND